MNCKKCGRPYYTPAMGVEVGFCSKECEDKFYLYKPRPKKWPEDERISEFSLDVEPLPVKAYEATVGIVDVKKGEPSKECEDEPEEELEEYVPEKRPRKRKKTEETEDSE
jgi:hypothetical protein